MLEIKVSKNSGFCFGVKHAISTAKKKSSSVNGKTIYTYGPLIHNESVIRELQESNIFAIDNLKKVRKGDIVIVRSHGVGETFFEDAKKLDIEVVDATCPFVSKIHDLVRDAYNQGYTVIIIGDKAHPEVVGINGWCDDKAIIMGNENDVDKIEFGSNNYFVVCQTTIRKELVDSVVGKLKEKNINFTVKNTICNATLERQEDTLRIAKECEMMLIIGDKKSSNTGKLYEISKKICKETYFIENIEDLSLKELRKYSRIGVAAGASTPDLAIKEVIAKMETVKEKNLMVDFMDEIEKSLRLPKSGEVVNGTVHQVTDKEVIVNLGCKKDGIIPKSEITLKEDANLKDLFNVGDEIEAKVIKTEDGDGGILLSRKKLQLAANMKELADAMENESVVEVKIERKVNGGVIASYKEVSGFMPLSQLSDKYVDDAQDFLGKEMDVLVVRMDPRRNRVVFSRKAILVKEKEARLALIWESIHEDDIVEGTVMRFTDYGAFVDLGGIDGLLHISEISWGKLKNPSEVLEIGQKVQVKILSINREKGKIALGLKQTMPEPWTVVNENYEVGQTITGKVVQIKEYGAFVEIEPGLDGLVHISEIAHRRVEKIEDELKVGQAVEAKILEIDSEKKRIALSISALIPKPEKEHKEDANSEVSQDADEKVEETEMDTEAMQDLEQGVEAEAVQETTEETVEE